ncbi:hypothetical protein Q3G72_002806 [Acer saccharum]|nr:hypothetical protein Q3G72_002806 [Acer saccharum]
MEHHREVIVHENASNEKNDKKSDTKRKERMVRRFPVEDGEEDINELADAFIKNFRNHCRAWNHSILLLLLLLLESTRIFKNRCYWDVSRHGCRKQQTNLITCAMDASFGDLSDGSADIKLEVMEVQSSDVEIKVGGVMTAMTDSSPIDIKSGRTPTTNKKKPKIESLWCNLPVQ